jgi:acyl-coenzyme A synthetase/AMP-(fatty) acid ligase
MAWIFDHINSLGKRDAISDSTGSYTYDELLEKMYEYHRAISSKIISGDTVVILSDYSFYSIALFLVLFNKKCIINPIVSKIQEEVNSKIEASSANKIIQITANGELRIELKVQKKTHVLISGLVEKNQSGLILFSSGSTGEPKAMVHNLDVLMESYKGKKLKKLNILVFLMFDHIGGLNTLLNTLFMGSHVILSFNRDALSISALIERHRIHVLPASPTFLNMMLIADVINKYDLSSLKIITYGTELMSESLLLRLRAYFPKVRLLQTFGTSETGIIKTSSRSSNSLEMKLGDNNQGYKVINGELWIRSKIQTLGYLNESMDRFTKDGWFCTGDLVEESDDGYIRIIGRKNEVINFGGEKVLPIEIESVLMEMDMVKDVVVFGINNAITNQFVAAKIYLNDGYNHSQAKKEIRKYCRSRLSKHKVPVKIIFTKNIGVTNRYKKSRTLTF